MHEDKTQQDYNRDFKKDTDEAFKHDEFEMALGPFMSAYIRCYPHLIEKKTIPHRPDYELWVFRFWVIGDPHKEKLRQHEFEIEIKAT